LQLFRRLGAREGLLEIVANCVPELVWSLELAGGKFVMKTLASLLGVLALVSLVTACGPDMQAINAATDKANADATRAEAAANSAEASANQADAASKQAESAASGAEDAATRARNAADRLEAAFATTVTK
jgi:hypothetical protein